MVFQPKTRNPPLNLRDLTSERWQVILCPPRTRLRCSRHPRLLVICLSGMTHQQIRWSFFIHSAPIQALLFHSLISLLRNMTLRGVYLKPSLVPVCGWTLQDHVQQRARKPSFGSFLNPFIIPLLIWDRPGSHRLGTNCQSQPHLPSPYPVAAGA